MEGSCHLRFYVDIMRYHESSPCRQRLFAYSTLVEGERVADAELAEIKRQYGASAGYVILDEAGFEVTSGGGRQSTPS